MSKGCILCRKRKIKVSSFLLTGMGDSPGQCDERKPQCAKCTRRGEPCPGYEGPRFIPYRSGEAPGFTAPMRNRRAVADPNQAIAPGPVVREQITSTFFHSHFPIHHGWRTLNPDVFPSLFAEIASLPRKTSMLQKAIAAISCVFLGKMNVDHRMLRHGSQLYNNAVGHMSHALSRQFYTDELLYTAIIFQELEVTPPPSSVDDTSDIHSGYLLPEQPGGIRHACRGNKFDLETVSSPDTCSSPDSRHLPQAPQVESSKLDRHCVSLYPRLT